MSNIIKNVRSMPKKDDKIKPATLINKMCLISYLVEIQPAKGVKIAVATIFPVTDQVIWSCVLDKAPIISGKAIVAINTAIPYNIVTNEPVNKISHLNALLSSEIYISKTY